MSRKAPGQPSYRLHKPSGKAVVTIDGKDHYLGDYGSAETRRIESVSFNAWRLALRGGIWIRTTRGVEKRP